MCLSVIYDFEGHTVKTEFRNPQAKLPVRMKSGAIILLPWGRRQGQRGNLPLGGWARMASIEAGRWDPYQPRPVKLALEQFMEEDYNHREQWFHLVKGQAIQGVVVRQGDEQRVYIVTIVPEHESAMYERWPKIMLMGMNQ